MKDEHVFTKTTDGLCCAQLCSVWEEGVGGNEISKKNTFSGVTPIPKLPQAHGFRTE